MNFNKLAQILAVEPKYRLDQAKQAIFKDLIPSWVQATVFPLALRQKLQKDFPLSISAKEFHSQDGRTVKIVLELDDRLKVETVLMSYPGRRNTVCVSSTVGCPLKCLFCATGELGFKRNLTADEIITQVLYFARYLKDKKQRVNSLVFMGMGEPFLNYDNIIAAIRTLNTKDNLHIGARHFSISTAGIPSGIKRLAEEKMEINLAVSLHAPDDQTRARLMPVARQYPLAQLFAAVDYYLKKTSRKVMFEYLLIKAVNDSDEQARQLSLLMNKKLYLVNLLTYNLTGAFEPSSPERLTRVQSILKKNGVAVTARYSFGADISAACGQLAGRI